MFYAQTRSGRPFQIRNSRHDDVITSSWRCHDFIMNCCVVTLTTGHEFWSISKMNEIHIWVTQIHLLVWNEWWRYLGELLLLIKHSKICHRAHNLLTPNVFVTGRLTEKNSNNSVQSLKLLAAPFAHFLASWAKCCGSQCQISFFAQLRFVSPSFQIVLDSRGARSGDSILYISIFGSGPVAPWLPRRDWRWSKLTAS